MQVHLCVFHIGTENTKTNLHQIKQLNFISIYLSIYLSLIFTNKK